jgi:PadR family transcriptional regulator, regulatory protein PadR
LPTIYLYGTDSGLRRPGAVMSWNEKNDAAELVVLSLLGEGRKYGYLLTKEAAARSDGQVRLTPGVLYPLLKRLETEGLVASSWEEVKAEASEESAEGRKRKWYRLSAKGKRRLEQRIAGHRAYRAIIDAFIGEPGQEGTAS